MPIDAGIRRSPQIYIVVVVGSREGGGRSKGSLVLDAAPLKSGEMITYAPSLGRHIHPSFKRQHIYRVLDLLKRLPQHGQHTVGMLDPPL